MPTATSQADIILNRTNVALARSRRLIQSWLPPLPPSDVSSTTAADQSTNHNTHNNNNNNNNNSDADSDFGGLDELAGLGSTKRKAEAEGLPDGALRRRKLASNEKLLEQLLGKKAVAERKKEREREVQRGRGRAGGGGVVVAEQVNKVEVVRKRDVESEEEEEGGGRAAALGSRRKMTRRVQVEVSDVQSEVERDAAGGSEKATPSAPRPAVVERDSDDDDQRPSKQKRGSYLDELLNQKATKKKKNKQKSNKTGSSSIPT